MTGRFYGSPNHQYKKWKARDHNPEQEEKRARLLEDKKSLGLQSASSVFVLLWQKQVLIVEFQDKTAGKAPVNKYHSITFFYTLHKTVKINTQVLTLRATSIRMQWFQSHYVICHNAVPFPEENLKKRKPYTDLDQWFVQPNRACDGLRWSIPWKGQALMMSSSFPLISIPLLSLAVYLLSVFPYVMKYDWLLI